MDEIAICERGAISKFSHRYQFWPWAHRAGTNICGLSLTKNPNETFGWWGFDGRHHPQQTTSMADVFPVWYLFDNNVWTIEWFSLFIIKTALDQYRQVVLLTHVFSFFLQVHYQHTANQKNRALLVWKTVGSNATHNITIIAHGCDVIHSFIFTYYLMHIYHLSYNKNKTN